MATTPFRFLQRRTSTSGRVPDIESLLSGELYIQLADETIYFRNNKGELVSVITDGDKFGLDKIKFTGANSGDFAVWNGSKFVAYSTGSLVRDLETGALASVFAAINHAHAQYVSTGSTGSFITASQTGSFITTSMTGAFGGASGVDLTSYVTTGSTGSFVTTSQTGAFAPTGDYVVASATGSFVTTSQTGAFAPTGDYVVASATGSFVTTSQTGSFASINGGYLSSSQIPQFTGDVCVSAGFNNTVVCKLQGYPVSIANPINGQTLQFNGSSWVPGDIPIGGNGGGGLTYYFNADVTPDDPITNLPTGKYPIKELGRVASTGQTIFTSDTLSQVSYTLIAEFVTDVLDPQVNSLPAGLFDFNFWALSDATASDQTYLQFKIFKYDGSTSPVLISTSDDVYIYDPSIVNQYAASVVLPQTSVSLTDRIYIQILGRANTNNKTISLKFGNNSPSHVHTTIPSVGGSGLVKVINGVMQSCASALVDSDVSASAAIAGSKIQSGFFVLASETGVYETSGYARRCFVNTGQIGNLALGGSGHFITGTNNVIYGGCSNSIAGTGATNCNNAILGGSGNCANFGYENALIGGRSNLITGSGFHGSSIIGGLCNIVRSGFMAIIASSERSCIEQSNSSSVIGGRSNRILCGNCSSIIGGCSNVLGCSSFEVGATSTIVGGERNFNISMNSAVVGGNCNFIGVSSSSCNSIIIGGLTNSIYNSTNSVIIGGVTGLICNATRSIILGGSGITGTVSDTVYVQNLCVVRGVIYGNGSGITGIATGCFITTSQTGAFGGGGGGGTVLPNGSSENSALCWNGTSWTTGQSYVATGSTGSFVTTSQTGQYVWTGSTGNFITTSQTGAFGGGGGGGTVLPNGSSQNSALCWNGTSWTTGQSYVATGSTGSFVTTSQTGQYVWTGSTGSFVTTSQTGQYVWTGSTGSFVTTSQTGQFVGTGQSGQFVWSGSTGRFLTTGQSGQFVWTGDTGRFITTGQTGVYETTGYARNCYVTTGQTGSFGGGVTCNIISGTVSGLTCLGDLCVSGQIFGTGLILGRSLNSNSFILGPANLHSISPAYSYPGFNLYFGSGHRTSDDGYGIGSSNIAIGGSSINFPGRSNSNTSLGSFCSTFLGDAYGSANNHIILNSCCVYVLGSNANASNKSASINVWCGSLVNVDNASLLNTVCSNIDHSYFSLILNSCRSNISTNQYTSRNTYINGYSGSIYGNNICDASILHGMQNCITGQCLNNISLIGSGLAVTGSGLRNIHIIGSNITAQASDTVYVNNLRVVNGVISGNGAGITGLNTGNFVTTLQTGAFAPSGNYVTTSQTGAFAPSGSYVTTSETGAFAPSGSYVATSQTGAFAPSGSYVTTSQTGAFAPSGSYVTTSQTGAFAPSGSYVTTSQTGAFGSGFVCNFNTGSNVSNIITNLNTNCICATGAQVCNSAILAGNLNTIIVTGNYRLCDSAIIGGYNNFISGSGCNSVVIGGFSNYSTGINSSIVGIYSSNNSKIGNGNYSASIIAGGNNFIACSLYTAILGGCNNCIFGTTQQCNNAIIGGCNNQICRVHASFGLCQSAIIGGNSNIIWSQCNNAMAVALIGANTSRIDSSSASAIVGGFTNCQCCTWYSTILGGYSNIITNGGCNGAILGGALNTISGSFVDRSDRSAIIGGESNYVNDGVNSAILGGSGNVMCSTATCTANSMIIGGSVNCISGVTNSIILGGSGNNFRSGVSNSIILGGNFITGTLSRTAYAESFSTHFCNSNSGATTNLCRDCMTMTFACSHTLGGYCYNNISANQNCFIVCSQAYAHSYQGTCNLKGMCFAGNVYSGNTIIQSDDIFLPSIVPGIGYTGSMYIIKGCVLGAYSSGTTYHRMFREFTEIYRSTGDAGFARDFICNGVNYASDATNFGTGKALLCLLNGRPTLVSQQRVGVPLNGAIPTCTLFAYDISVNCLVIDVS